MAFKKEEAHLYNPRLDEINYNLHINDVQASDEGRYLVQCWYRARNGSDIYLYTKSVDLKLQETGIIRTRTIKPRTGVNTKQTSFRDLRPRKAQTSLQSYMYREYLERNNFARRKLKLWTSFFKELHVH